MYIMARMTKLLPVSVGESKPSPAYIGVPDGKVRGGGKKCARLSSIVPDLSKNLFRANFS